MALKKTLAKKSTKGAFPSRESLKSTRFHTISDFQKFDSLIKYRSVSSERVVVLDELSPFLGNTLSLGAGCLFVLVYHLLL